MAEGQWINKVEYDVTLRVRVNGDKLQSSSQVMVEVKRVIDKANNLLGVTYDIERIQKAPVLPDPQTSLIEEAAKA